MKTRAFILACAVPLLCSPSSGQPSRGGNFLATVEFLGNAQTAPQWNTWRAVVSAEDGSRRFIIEKRIPFDVPPPSIVVSDAAGAAVVIESFEGIVEFYDGSGRLLQTWKPFATAGPDYEQMIRCSVAGEKAAFLIGRPGEGSARVVLSTMRGERLWENRLEHPVAGGIVLADSADVLLACSYEVGTTLAASTVTLGAGGVELRRLPVYWTCADLSPHGDRFAIAGRCDVTVGSTRSAGMDHTWSVADSAHVLTAVCLYGGGVAVAAESFTAGSGGPSYTDLRLMTYGEKGMLLGEKDSPGVAPAPARLGRRGRGVVVSLSGREQLLDFPTAK